jgi:hypothetical protein
MRDGVALLAKTLTVIPDAQLRIADAPLGAGPESKLPAGVMDSGLAHERAPE